MDKLKRFLVKAKIATYATGGEFAEKKLDDNSKELIFEEESFKYRDRYFGHNSFIGEEIVWRNNKLLWGMNYFGEIVSKEVSSEKLYNFLKEALKMITKDLPFRGPKEFKKGDFSYQNKVEGNISNFSGKEIIYYKNKIVYFLKYHGGIINTDKD